GKFAGDGAYDKWKVYETMSQRDITPIIPPRKDAKIKQHGNSKELKLARDEAIRGTRKLGRSEWKRQVGYHRRSLSETAMYRMKTIFGQNLKNRNKESQDTEVKVRYKILNHFTKKGLPILVII
ncbi:MAG: IS5 family transposase, partial [Planctomycetaceae bacterium]|nr:IS5 family transposase [Planctomycetaceae bacterium]